MAAQPVCTHWDIEVASLSLRSGTLTSQYKDQLKTKLLHHDKTLQTFIRERESWTQQTFDTVNWIACETVQHSSGFRETAKSMHPTHTSITGIQGQDIQSSMKNHAHVVSATMTRKIGNTYILTCESMDANLNRAASWAKLEKSMEAWHLPQGFWIALEKGIAHTTNQVGTPTNIPLPLLHNINKHRTYATMGSI
jgi:hypothetical protein